MRIELPSGHTVLIDAADWPLVSQYRWTLHDRDRPSPYVRGYRIGDRRGPRVYLHVLIMSPVPAGMKVDHRYAWWDMRRASLRICPQALNARNVRARAGRRYKGVFWDAGARRWGARLWVNGTHHYGGSHVRAADAARAYDALAIEHHGDYARTNFRRPRPAMAGAEAVAA